MATPVRIIGRRLPGANWSGRQGIHIGVQRGTEVEGIVTGASADAVFEVEVEIVEHEDQADFRGPYVLGRRGERYICLTWVEVGAEGAITPFRRLRLHLSPLPQAAGGVPQLLAAKRIQAVLELTDTRGRPIAASVRPPWVTWQIFTR